MGYFSQWKAEMRSALADLETVFEDRFGYPADPGANFVREPNWSDADSDLLYPRDLGRFYSEVGEVSLADVHYGYFIHPADRLSVSVDWGLPTRLACGMDEGIATFGSDGGGGLFCVVLKDGSVYHLPPGEIVDGLYLGGFEEPRLVAPDFEGFAGKLLAVTKEFVARGSTRGIDSF